MGISLLIEPLTLSPAERARRMHELAQWLNDGVAQISRHLEPKLASAIVRGGRLTQNQEAQG